MNDDERDHLAEIFEAVEAVVDAWLTPEEIEIRLEACLGIAEIIRYLEDSQ